MKMNHSQSAGYIETHYSNEFFEMSEEALFERYKEDLVTFLSGKHVQNMHNNILSNIEKATGSLFGDNLGVVIIESLSQQDDYAVQLNSNNVIISPNYVMHNGKPFIIGPYVQHNYKLEFVIHIPTIDSDVSKLHLSFTINAIGEEEGEISCFYITEDIHVNTSALSLGDKLENYHILNYVKGMIYQHIEKNKVNPVLGDDVKAFNTLLLEVSHAMINAE